VYYHDSGGHLQWLPAAWTSVIAEDPVVVAGAGKSAFRVADLLALSRLLAGLGPSLGLDQDAQTGPGGVK
jgi:hypothetical protein